jgi:hypothetical protein
VKNTPSEHKQLFSMPLPAGVHPDVYQLSADLCLDLIIPRMERSSTVSSHSYATLLLEYQCSERQNAIAFRHSQGRAFDLESKRNDTMERCHTENAH